MTSEEVQATVPSMKWMFLVAGGVLMLTYSATRVDASELDAIRTAEDLDRLLAEESPANREVLESHRVVILAAAETREHVKAVLAAIREAPGTVETVNTTPAPLRKAFGLLALFETITSVDLSQSGMSVKTKRETDPYDAAFYRHLGAIGDVRVIRVLHTRPKDEWVAPLGKLTNLTRLEFINTGMSDAGLAHFATLPRLERFAYIGTQMTGAPFADFSCGETLVSSSFRGSKIDDTGLRALCEAFPHYETLSLAHAKFTDAGAPYLAKLTKLKNLEIGSPNATAACLEHLADLPLEYLQLGDGLDTPEGLAKVLLFPHLRRLTLTKAPGIGPDEIRSLASMKQLRDLEIGSLDLNDEQIAALGSLPHLESLRLVRYSDPYGKVLRKKVAAVLPGVELRFR